MEAFEILSNLTYWLSITFSLICIIYYCFYKFINTDKNCFCNENNLKSISYHAVMDVAMVVTYIFIGLFITNFIIDVIIGTEKFEILLTSSIYIIVFLSAIYRSNTWLWRDDRSCSCIYYNPKFPNGSYILMGLSCRNFYKWRWNLHDACRK